MKKYYNLKEMKHGDLILTNRNDKIGKIIAYLTGGKYSHVMLYMGSGRVCESSIFGVIMRSITTEELDSFEVEVVRHNNEISENDMHKINDYLYDMIGRPYSFIDAIRCASLFIALRNKTFRLFKPSSVGLFCSRLAANAYNKINIKLFESDELSPPNKIMKVHGFSKVHNAVIAREYTISAQKENELYSRNENLLAIANSMLTNLIASRYGKLMNEVWYIPTMLILSKELQDHALKVARRTATIINNNEVYHRRPEGYYFNALLSIEEDRRKDIIENIKRSYVTDMCWIYRKHMQLEYPNSALPKHPFVNILDSIWTEYEDELRNLYIESLMVEAMDNPSETHRHDNFLIAINNSAKNSTSDEKMSSSINKVIHLLRNRSAELISNETEYKHSSEYDYYHQKAKIYAELNLLAMNQESKAILSARELAFVEMEIFMRSMRKRFVRDRGLYS